MPTPEQRKKVGQLFAVGFHGREPDDNIKSLIRDYGVGAIVLFKRNVRGAAQLQSLCLALQREAREAGHEQPLLVGIDQENGLVTRISPPVTAQLPGPMTLGAAGAPAHAEEVGRATGEALRYFGINMNYAPVGDVNNEPLNPVIGVRSPGDDPQRVAEFASACARGLRAAGVVPCIKHFPGHGDTAVDSHFGLPVVDKSRADLDRVELVPFRRAAGEGIEMIMTAHIALPQLGEADPKLPATLSPVALGILRDEMRYEGVIMTDCLEMDGVRATYGTVEGALIALQAGADNVMICHTYEVQAGAIDRVCQALEAGDIAQERIDTSLARLQKLKAAFTSWEAALQARPPAELAAINEKNAALAHKVYTEATTLVRSKPGVLPLPRTGTTVFLSPGADIPRSGVVGYGVAEEESRELATRVPWTSSRFGDALRRYNPDVVDVRFQTETLTDKQWEEVEQAEHVILTTRNARESSYQRRLGLEVAARRARAHPGRPVVFVASCNPYDFADEAGFETYLAVYEPTFEAFASAADIIYGAAEPRGKLPVTM